MAVMIQAGGDFLDLHAVFYERTRWADAGAFSMDLPPLSVVTGHVINVPGIHTESGYAAQLPDGNQAALFGVDIVLTKETGRLATGTVTALLMIDPAQDTRFALYDSAVSASQIMQAAFTADLADDRALIAGLLGGDDIVMGHETMALSETLRAGAGADLVIGFAGRDRLFGEAGEDLLIAGRGRDAVSGGAGRDLIAGGTGEGLTSRGDVLSGGAGADKLLVDGHGYRMAGGGGADVFVFVRGGTGSRITDFTDGADRVLIDGWTHGFDALQISRASDGGLQVQAGTTVFTLEGIALRDLDASDFILGRDAETYVVNQLSGWLDGWTY